MMEYPESRVIAAQLAKTAAGRKVVGAEAGKTPHRFAFFNGEPAMYQSLLEGRRVDSVYPYGSYVQLCLGSVTLILGDGVALRWFKPGEERPDKHQLRLEFDDGSALQCRVAMYGGMWAQEGVSLNPYHRAAIEKPDILGEGFTPAYFESLLQNAKPSLSMKAFLATEQRIPGLGNGTLQDILYNARLHPKTPVSTLDEAATQRLYDALRSTMAQMAGQGGRDTELDLFGWPGGYDTQLCRGTLGSACPRCGQTIKKAAYLGGSIYWCPGCQPV